MIVGSILLVSGSMSVLYLPWLPQIVMILSVVVALAYFTRPEISLVIFFALRALFDLLWWVPAEIFGLNIMEVFSGAVAGLALVLVSLEFHRFNNHPAVPALVPYLGVMIVASIRNLDIRTGLEILARYLSPFLIMLLVSAFFVTVQKRRRLFLVISVVCVIPVLNSLYHLATGQINEYYLDGYYRLRGGYKNLHNHALMMMFIVTLGLYWLMQSKRIRSGLVFLGWVVAAMVCLYFTYVRTALLGLVACSGVYLWITGRTRLLMLGTFAAFVLLLSSDTMQDRFQDILHVFTLDATDNDRAKLGSGRWALWTVSMSEYLGHSMGDIILGLGLGQHRELTKPIFTATAAMNSKFVDPHNDYLSLMYQMGPIALLSYLAAQVQVARYGLYLAWKSPDPWVREFAAYVVALDATALVTNALSNSFLSRTTLGWYFWGLAGLLYAAWFQHKQQLISGAIEELPLRTNNLMDARLSKLVPSSPLDGTPRA